MIDEKPRTTDASDKMQDQRVTVRLRGKLGPKITEILENTPAETPTDVVRRALILYHTLVREQMAGHDLQVVDRSNPDAPVPRPIIL